MKNILIVGGAGFVGFHLTRRLLEEPGVEVITIFDNLSSGTMANVPTGHLKVRFEMGNARDFDRLRVVTAGHDTVFHLAANPDISKAESEPTLDFEQGTVLTKNVLEAMRVNGVRNLIYFSGSGVYGETHERVSEEYGPLLPISPYGAAKLASEAMICAYCYMFKLQARAFRFANLVGRRQTHGVGFDFLRRLKADPTKLRILGDGSQSKSYLHIDDALNAVIMIARIALETCQGSATCYRVYNVASRDRLTVLDIAEMAFQTLGIARPEYEFTGGDRGWNGDVPTLLFDTTAIRSRGWGNERDSREAMRDALAGMAADLK